MSVETKQQPKIIMKKYLQHIAYSLAIIAAAFSNFVIDKTETSSDITDLQEQVTKLQFKQDETNIGLITYRLNNMDKELEKTNTSLISVNDKADRILLILARSSN